MLPSSLDQSLQSSKRANSGKNSNLLPASATFPRNTSTGYRDGVESVASISTWIWQDFPLMSFYPWLFKGITGISLLENPSELCQPWRGPCGGPPSRVDMGYSNWCGRIWQNLRGQSSPVSQLIVNGTLISGLVFCWWTPRRVQSGKPRYFRFLAWRYCSCNALTWRTFA